MAPDLSLEGQSQRILNDLLAEGLLPFKLVIREIIHEIDEYHIYFRDSRIHMAVIPLVDGFPLDDLIRLAVLARVGKTSGPLRMPLND